MSATDPQPAASPSSSPPLTRACAAPRTSTSAPPSWKATRWRYLTLERLAAEEGAEPRFRLSAAGYGPAGETLAERLCTQITAWGDGRTAEPVISLYPAGTPDDQLADGYVIEKPSTRMVISY